MSEQRRSRRPADEMQQWLVDKWNELYPAGTPVRVRTDSRGTIETVTRSAAELLSGHTAVVWLKGIAGCYSLERVTAISEPEVEHA